MGVLPLQFLPGENPTSVGLTGTETFTIHGIADDLTPKKKLTVSAAREDDSNVEFQVVTRIDSPVEIDYYRHGGILQMVLRRLIAGRQTDGETPVA
jgi:aconitate hydratase